jgi:23S rRNA (cytidine1920-2'-O)/16S rRNA (cytidine1409-2'-O)-methyltransferase
MKQRLDNILVQRGFFSSRSQAAAAVMAGEVTVAGQTMTKAGTMVAGDAVIELKEQPRFVSRGGLKLEKAFQEFPIDVSGRVALDAGASTGGFTDCLLQHGARKVIAVDVGYGQLDWKLRQDPRVEVMERTNIRGLTPDKLAERPDFATFDLSFISLRKVLPVVVACLDPSFEAIALIKPQFEVGKEKVGKGGVVRDEDERQAVVADMRTFIESRGWQVRGVTESPIKGPKGNMEYLLYFAAS